MRKVPRTRVAEGIWSDKYGVSGLVKLGGVQREARFPHGTALEHIQSWRVQTRAELDAERGTVPVVTGTLRADGEKWIKRKAGMACHAADRSHLAAWYPALGDRVRNSINRQHVETVMSTWRTHDPPVAVRTIRHRCRVLRELFHALDGAKGKTPLDEVSLPAVPAPQPAAVPLATIRAVAKRLKQAKRLKDYARFLVRATTGQRPAQIMRALPGDVDLRRRIWFVRPSKGGTAIPFPLNLDAVEAWKAFSKAKAWGPFDTGTAAATLRRYGWPEHVRPYDLRHTFAIDLLLSGADLGDVQGLLGHSQIQTTRTHYAPILTARLAKVTNRRRLKLG
jgi:integrase